MSHRSSEPKRRPPKPFCAKKDRIVAVKHVISDPDTDEILEQTDDGDAFLVLIGHDNVDPAYEALLVGLSVGSKQAEVIAYLPPDPDAIWEEPRDNFPPEGVEGAPLQGEMIAVEDAEGRPWLIRVVYCDRFTLRLSTNDPYAGRTVHVALEVVSVRPAEPVELIAGYPVEYLSDQFI